MNASVLLVGGITLVFIGMISGVVTNDIQMYSLHWIPGIILVVMGLAVREKQPTPPPQTPPRNPPTGTDSG